MAGVLDVSVQSDNFCLFYQTGNWFFCHAKSEWAAWVQAIGSIIAILASVGVVFLSSYLSSKAKRIEDAKKEMVVLVLYLGVMHNFKVLLKSFKEHAGRESLAQRWCEYIFATLQKTQLITPEQLKSLSVLSESGAMNFAYAINIIGDVEIILEHALNVGEEYQYTKVIDNIFERFTNAISYIDKGMDMFEKEGIKYSSLS